jgi:hypothetical protein
VAWSMKNRRSSLKRVITPFAVVTARLSAHVNQYIFAWFAGFVCMLRSAGTAKLPTVIVMRRI